MTQTRTTATRSAAGSHTPEEGREPVVTEDGRVLHDPTHAQHIGHGNTPGGWLMAALVVVGFAAGCVGLLTDAWIVVWIGVALMVIGALVGIVAAKADARRGHVGH